MKNWKPLYFELPVLKIYHPITTIKTSLFLFLQQTHITASCKEAGLLKDSRACAEKEPPIVTLVSSVLVKWLFTLRDTDWFSNNNQSNLFDNQIFIDLTL
jgi:hypothetical protein